MGDFIMNPASTLPPDTVGEKTGTDVPVGASPSRFVRAPDFNEHTARIDAAHAALLDLRAAILDPPPRPSPLPEAQGGTGAATLGAAMVLAGGVPELMGIWIGDTPPATAITYAQWLAGTPGYWAWLDTSTTPVSLTVPVLDASVEMVVPGLTNIVILSRLSTGKLLFDDFSGTLAAWTVTGNVAVVGGKARMTVNAGAADRLQSSFASNVGIYITARMKMYWTASYPSDARILSSDAADVQTDAYELGVMNTNSAVRNSSLGKNIASVRTMLRDWGAKETTTVERAYAMKASGGSLQTYLDGAAQGAPVADAAFGTFDKIQVLGIVPAADAGGYVEWDDIAVMKSHAITVANLPAGWKARCAGVAAVESAGTATLDMSGVAFPQSAVEVLDGGDVVRGTFSAPTDIWGGDALAVN